MADEQQGSDSYINLRSGTFWGGLVLIGLGVFQISTGDMIHGAEVISAGAAIIAGRRAIGASGGLSK